MPSDSYERRSKLLPKVNLDSRQYKYVHALKDVISPELDAGDMYRREGRYYTNNYPMLLNASWYAYVFVFPAILAIATTGLI